MHSHVLEVAAAAIFDSEGRVLTCRRNIERREGGMWEFPGGKVEAGETPAEAVVREVREELGVEILVGHLIASESTARGNVTIHLSVYAAGLVGRGPTTSSGRQISTARTASISAITPPIPRRS